MHIKVIDTDEAEIREVNVFVHVVQNAVDEFAISYKSNSCTITTPVGTFSISYDANSCTLTTPFEHFLDIKDWKDTRYKQCIPVNNRQSLWDWWYYAKVLLGFGNVGVYIDLSQKRLEIYVNEGMAVYLDGKLVVQKGTTHAY